MGKEIRQTRRGIAPAGWGSAAIAVAAFCGPAAAEPTITAEVTAEIQYENGVGPDSAKPQSDFLFTTVETGLSLGLSERVSVESVVLLEIFDDPPPGADSVFDDHGLFAEELVMAYHGDSWSLLAGKFNAAFGVGWDLGPGIWGVDFPEDYEVAEKIGFAGTRTFTAGQTGQHTLYGSVYRADRSLLSESLFDNRGRVRLADGGATNTKDFDSFTLSLTGEDIVSDIGLGYHLAYRSHAHADVDFNAVREDAVAAAVFGALPFDTIDIEAMAEAVYVNNAEGTLDDVSYLTLGGTAYFADSWNAALSVTFRSTDLDGGGTVKDHRFQATTGFEFQPGASFDFGYRYSREDGQSDHVLGFLMVYAFSL
jgi:hypothetical protein